MNAPLPHSPSHSKRPAQAGFTVIAIASLAACLAGTPAQAQPASPSGVDTSGAIAQDTHTNPTGAHGMSEGRRTAGTPAIHDLDTLIRAALASSPQVAGAHALRREAEFNLSSARAQYLPTPSMEYGRGNRGNNQGSLRLEQPIWTGGAISANVAAADARSDASVSGVALAQDSAAVAVLDAWRDYTLAHVQEKALRDMLAEYDRLLSLIGRRIDGGASATSDRAYVQARMNQVRSQLAHTLGARASALAALKTTINAELAADELDTLVKVIDEPVQFDTWSPTAANQAAQSRSPRIAQARAQAAAAEHDTQAQRANGLPHLYVSLQKNFTGGNNNAYQDDQVRVMVNVRFTPGAGWSQISRSDAAAQRALDAQARVRESANAIEIELRQLLAQLQSEIAQRESLKAQHAADTDVYASYQRLFDAGRRTWTDVLNTLRDKNSTELYQAANAVSLKYLDARLRILTTGRVGARTTPQ
ncbi:hypothetical protein CEK29_16200 [Bordetella genomosp. 5]|uniref:TolC family protein n=1 Tax=Bordetella genomosp. 5 TaxID=1395608 RepID=UPI000B9E3C90|nr:TolC family protein [Bordetella genomosp. 5]OZI41465.1 hypothetical protein CEK29_16200 [Bordetella genomosp. 5]